MIESVREVKRIFQGHSYINLETYRKNGAAVRTPVWFAQEGERLYVWTHGNSGKAKRIQRDGKVRVAPCDARGLPLGEWAAGQATVYSEKTHFYEHGNRLMNKKYGLMKRMFELLGHRSNVERVIITVDLK